MLIRMKSKSIRLSKPGEVIKRSESSLEEELDIGVESRDERVLGQQQVRTAFIQVNWITVDKEL